MWKDTRSYMNRTWSEYYNAEKRIDRDIMWRIKIMRNTIPSNIISKDFLNFILYSLLSDQSRWWCKQMITNWYKMSDSESIRDDEENKRFPTLWNSIPSVWLENNIEKNEEDINTIRERFEKKKKQRSYNRSSWFNNWEKFENTFKEKIAKHDLKDVTLNEVFELAIADLMEDFMREEILKYKKDIQNIKVHKTSHYDDVMAKSDFVVEFEYWWHKEYGAYDFTISHDIANLQRKEQLDWVYCREFAYNNWIKWKMPRSLFVINDKDIVFNYLNDYIQHVLENDWNIEDWEALKIFENMEIFWSTHNIENVKRNIRNQLFNAA